MRKSAQFEQQEIPYFQVLSSVSFLAIYLLYLHAALIS